MKVVLNLAFCSQRNGRKASTPFDDKRMFAGFDELEKPVFRLQLSNDMGPTCARLQDTSGVPTEYLELNRSGVSIEA